MAARALEGSAGAWLAAYAFRHCTYSYVLLSGWRQEGQAWTDFVLLLLPWPVSSLLGWLLPPNPKQQLPGKAPKPPKSIAIIIHEAPRDAAFIQSLAQNLAWMAQAGLSHISVYDPQGAAPRRCQSLSLPFS